MSITDLLKEKVEKQLNALSEQLEAAEADAKAKKAAADADAAGAELQKELLGKVNDLKGKLIEGQAYLAEYMDYDALGWKERLEHAREIRAGKPSYFIMCKAVDSKASPREIDSFDSKTVFVGGEIEEFDGDTWVELVDRLPVGKAKAAIAPKERSDIRDRTQRGL